MGPFQSFFKTSIDFDRSEVPKVDRKKGSRLINLTFRAEEG